MSDKKDPFQKELKSFVTNTLRRASFRWKPRDEALKAARIDRGVYRCAQCGCSFKRADVQIDHIEPVVSLKDGFTSWDDFIKRLYCSVDGFQIICTTCHDTKTIMEDALRATYNQERKAEDKEEAKKLKEFEKQMRKKKKEEE